METKWDEDKFVITIQQDEHEINENMDKLNPLVNHDDPSFDP